MKTNRRPCHDQGHILLVDDEPAVRDLARVILRSRGYRVTSATNGREAIDRFLEHRGSIDLVVTDLNMPDLDGHGLTVVLKRLRPEIKIVVMTGLGSSQGAAVCADWVAAVLLKPFTREELLHTVERIIADSIPSQETAGLTL